MIAQLSAAQRRAQRFHTLHEICIAIVIVAMFFGAMQITWPQTGPYWVSFLILSLAGVANEIFIDLNQRALADVEAIKSKIRTERTRNAERLCCGLCFTSPCKCIATRKVS